MTHTLADYVRAILRYWILIVLGTAFAVSNAWKWHHPKRTDLPIPHWLRWTISVIAILIASFLAYRDQAKNLETVIQEKQQAIAEKDEANRKLLAYSEQSSNRPKRSPGRPSAVKPKERQLSPASVVTMTHLLMEYWVRNKAPGVITLYSLIGDDEATALRFQLLNQFDKQAWQVKTGELSARKWAELSETQPIGLVILSRNHDYLTTFLNDLFEELGLHPVTDYHPKNFNELEQTTVFIGKNQ